MANSLKQRGEALYFLLFGDAKLAQSAASAALSTTQVAVDIAEHLPVVGGAAKIIGKVIILCENARIAKTEANLLKGRLIAIRSWLLDDDGFKAVTEKASEPKKQKLKDDIIRLENVLYDAEKVFNSFVQAGYFAYLFGQSNTSKFRDLSDRLQDAENALTNTITRLNFGSQEELMRKMEEFYGSNSEFQSDVRMNIGAVFDKLLEIDQRLSESGGLSSLQNAANREKICSALDTDPQSFSTEFERYFARVEEALKRIEDKGQENAAAMKEQMERIEASIANINANKSFSTGPIFPDFDIRQFNYDPSRCIGHKASAFGTVCEGMYCTVPIAVKVLTDNSDTSARALERELRILMAVEKLPGVVRIHGGNASLENGQPLYVAMERAQGSLYGALHEGSPSVDWSLLSKLEIINSIANAITALSDAGIVHGNLKATNVLLFLVGESWVPKLTDFGFARHAAISGPARSISLSKGATSALAYLAPELWGSHGLSPSTTSDVYAFGILCNEIMTQEIPFKGLDYEKISARIRRKETPQLFKASAGDPVLLTVRKVVASCLADEPMKRPSIKTAFDHLKSSLLFLTNAFTDAGVVDRTGLAAEMSDSSEKPRPLSSLTIQEAIFLVAELNGGENAVRHLQQIKNISGEQLATYVDADVRELRQDLQIEQHSVASTLRKNLVDYAAHGVPNDVMEKVTQAIETRRKVLRVLLRDHPDVVDAEDEEDYMKNQFGPYLRDAPAPLLRNNDRANSIPVLARMASSMRPPSMQDSPPPPVMRQPSGQALPYAMTPGGSVGYALPPPGVGLVSQLALPPRTAATMYDRNLVGYSFRPVGNTVDARYPNGSPANMNDPRFYQSSGVILSGYDMNIGGHRVKLLTPPELAGTELILNPNCIEVLSDQPVHQVVFEAPQPVIQKPTQPSNSGCCVIS